MILTVDLTNEDIQRAIEEYVTKHNPSDLEGFNARVVYHKDDDRPGDADWFTATCQLRHPAQGKD